MSHSSRDQHPCCDVTCWAGSGQEVPRPGSRLFSSTSPTPAESPALWNLTLFQWLGPEDLLLRERLQTEEGLPEKPSSLELGLVAPSILTQDLYPGALPCGSRSGGREQDFRLKYHPPGGSLSLDCDHPNFFFFLAFPLPPHFL